MPSKVVTTLFEHEFTEGFAWDDGFLRAVERLNQRFGAEVLRCTTRRGQREVQAAQHVGVFRVGGRTVQVLPKFCRSEEDRNAQTREAMRNLVQCLGYARQLPVRESGLVPLLSNRDADWFEVLTRLFATHLTAEWKRGPVRSYRARDAELTRLRGKWRVSRQLRRPERRHVFAVTYDEFTADNPLNQVFRYVTEALWRSSRDPGNRILLAALRDWMEAVTLRPAMTAADADPSLVTRLTERFELVLNLARLFLEGGASELHAGGDRSSYAFFFDMNVLFEAFIAGFLRRHRAAILPDGLSEAEVLPQSKGAIMHLARSGSGQGKSVFRLKPDIALRTAAGAGNGADMGSFPLLIDTKYKRLDVAKTSLSVDPGDFYQMYAYARRYDCPAVLLLYPYTTGMAGPPVRRSFALEGRPSSVLVATVDVRRPVHTRAGREELVTELRDIIGGVIGGTGMALT